MKCLRSDGQVLEFSKEHFGIIEGKTESSPASYGITIVIKGIGEQFLPAKILERLYFHTDRPDTLQGMLNQLLREFQYVEFEEV
jgi:hypothetical protein